jgi:hypothetical protein
VGLVLGAVDGRVGGRGDVILFIEFVIW